MTVKMTHEELDLVIAALEESADMACGIQDGTRVKELQTLRAHLATLLFDDRIEGGV